MDFVWYNIGDIEHCVSEIWCLYFNIFRYYLLLLHLLW